MGNLLAYSGIVTKVRAMEGKLLKPEQFTLIAGLPSVPDIVDYLKKTLIILQNSVRSVAIYLMITINNRNSEDGTQNTGIK